MAFYGIVNPPHGNPGEGLVVKLPRSPYLFGQRSAYWMKIKRSPSLYKAVA
jgi:ATP-dependent DNA ligase